MNCIEFLVLIRVIVCMKTVQFASEMSFVLFEFFYILVHSNSNQSMISGYLNSNIISKIFSWLLDIPKSIAQIDIRHSMFVAFDLQVFTQIQCAPIYFSNYMHSWCALLNATEWTCWKSYPLEWKYLLYLKLLFNFIGSPFPSGQENHSYSNKSTRQLLAINHIQWKFLEVKIAYIYSYMKNFDERKYQILKICRNKNNPQCK